MFSKACTYGIRAMILITKKSQEGCRIGVKEISKDTDTPEPFVAKILQQLTKLGLIQSNKGPKGGFSISDEQKETTLYTIVKAIDGDTLMTGCGLGFHECSEERPCPMHNKFKSVRAGLNDMLSETTLGELSTDVVDGLSFLQG
ncbi:RrF2 family transcriptional regulator [Flammeovirga kamogawensis]|uniref:Rrf2 family transcriptional regulator n=1 Tax=Flammeovirga kamogawensis TaxID=373891 RepID=A0ABX8GYN2_9BACT|nr:Rrf2 family transcriptional regulator [Flammeovirga kamogawensis]MBB6459116.1 Rrf2 family protein [Flammeovirga kamogawensis]QWG08685.1 Rrf2 family transcriptional regulator [Flammeovirga kamogawensis]TRX66978.1 Rrf2 family transcriptional regulator [Flammeovirga kamogawensis]